MKVDAGGYASTVPQAGDAARDAEAAGYDGWWAAETQIDPFIGCAVAAERTAGHVEQARQPRMEPGDREQPRPEHGDVHVRRSPRDGGLGGRRDVLLDPSLGGERQRDRAVDGGAGAGAGHGRPPRLAERPTAYAVVAGPICGRSCFTRKCARSRLPTGAESPA